MKRIRTIFHWTYDDLTHSVRPRWCLLFLNRILNIDLYSQRTVYYIYFSVSSGCYSYFQWLKLYWQIKAWRQWCYSITMKTIALGLCKDVALFDWPCGPLRHHFISFNYFPRPEMIRFRSAQAGTTSLNWMATSGFCTSIWSVLLVCAPGIVLPSSFLVFLDQRGYPPVN